MGKNVYITNLSSFLPNEPVENDAMEDVLGYIGGHSSRIKRIILSQNQIIYTSYDRKVYIKPFWGNLWICANS